MTRPEIPSAPVLPFPLTECSHVEAGFGRGSADLGIPTANVCLADMSDQFKDLDPGVYFGFCRLAAENKATEIKQVATKDSQRSVQFNYGSGLTSKQLQKLYPHVMSIGWNPFYGNQEKTVEIHVIDKFNQDFYGAKIHFNVLGYVRPELNYTTKEALIEDINTDIKDSLATLEKQEYSKFSHI